MFTAISFYFFPDSWDFDRGFPPPPSLTDVRHWCVYDKYIYSQKLSECLLNKMSGHDQYIILIVRFFFFCSTTCWYRQRYIVHCDAIDHIQTRAAWWTRYVVTKNIKKKQKKTKYIVFCIKIKKWFQVKWTHCSAFAKLWCRWFTAQCTVLCIRLRWRQFQGRFSYSEAH